MEDLNPIKLFLNKIYYFLFVERSNKKLSFNFPKNIFRWDLIQHIIIKYDYIYIRYIYNFNNQIKFN